MLLSLFKVQKALPVPSQKWSVSVPLNHERKEFMSFNISQTIKMFDDFPGFSFYILNLCFGKDLHFVL